MGRIPWWGLVVIMGVSLLVTWFTGRLLLKRYRDTWPF